MSTPTDGGPVEPEGSFRPPWTLVVPAAVAMLAAAGSAVLMLIDGWQVYRHGMTDLFAGWYLVGALTVPWAAAVVFASAWSLRRSRYAHLPLVGLLLPALVVSLVALESQVDQLFSIGWLVITVGCLGGLLSPPTWRYQSTGGVIGSRRRNGRR